MGTAERRLELLKYLCRKRHSTMTQLSEMFGVSIRTIQRDILEIEMTFHVPIEVRCGNYGGGIYIIGDYSFDRTYMHADELQLLSKIQDLLKNQLSEQENILLSRMIKTYTKSK